MPSVSEDEPFLLVTIPQSHFCEKARWALDRLAEPYTEEPHLPYFHLPATLLRGGKRTVPLLKSRTRSIPDSTDILHYLDTFADDERLLFPKEDDLRKEVIRLEDHFDEVLGPAARLWVYSQLLPDKKLSVSIIENAVPAYEAPVGKALFGVVRRMMFKRMNINKETAAQALEVTRDVFDEVGRLLSDGRAFLVGDRFTAADLTFASLAAIVLLPKEYKGPLPTIEQAPAEMKKAVEEFRAHPAGRFALKMFATLR